MILGAALLVTLLMTAFGSSNRRTVNAAAPAPAQRLLPTGPPSPQVIALQGAVRIQLPVPQERLTAIGVYGTGDTALPLRPLGTKGNQGFITRTFHRIFGGGTGHGPRYYSLGGASPGNTALDVGAAAGTDVYSPVDGNVVGLTPYVINGRKVGAQIDIQPLAAPSGSSRSRSSVPTRRSRSGTRSPPPRPGSEQSPTWPSSSSRRSRASRPMSGTA